MQILYLKSNHNINVVNMGNMRNIRIAWPLALVYFSIGITIPFRYFICNIYLWIYQICENVVLLTWCSYFNFKTNAHNQSKKILSGISLVQQILGKKQYLFLLTILYTVGQIDLSIYQFVKIYLQWEGFKKKIIYKLCTSNIERGWGYQNVLLSMFSISGFRQGMRI